MLTVIINHHNYNAVITLVRSSTTAEIARVGGRYAVQGHSM